MWKAEANENTIGEKKKDLVHLTLILAEEHRATALENPIGSCRESMKKTRGIGASSHYLSHR